MTTFYKVVWGIVIVGLATNIIHLALIFGVI
jgi:hypothetical protein